MLKPNNYTFAPTGRALIHYIITQGDASLALG